MSDDRKSVADEVAELTEAVHELRDREVADELARLREEVAALRAGKDSGCHGHCTCIHWHYTPTPWYPVTQPVYTVTNIGGAGSGALTCGATTSTVNYC